MCEGFLPIQSNMFCGKCCLINRIFFVEWNINNMVKSQVVLCLRDFHIFYYGHPSIQSIVMMIVHNHFQPFVVHQDVHDRFLIVEIMYEEQFLELVSVYAPHNVGIISLFWRDLQRSLRLEKLVWDFKFFSLLLLKTYSPHSKMDNLERQVWDSFVSLVYKQNIWHLLILSSLLVPPVSSYLENNLGWWPFHQGVIEQILLLLGSLVEFLNVKRQGTQEISYQLNYKQLKTTIFKHPPKLMVPHILLMIERIL